MLQLQAHMKRCKALAERPAGEDVASTALIEACVKEFRDKLEMSSKDTSYTEVRDDIVAYTESVMARPPMARPGSPGRRERESVRMLRIGFPVLGRGTRPLETGRRGVGAPGRSGLGGAALS